jgi:hypothetical protein
MIELDLESPVWIEFVRSRFDALPSHDRSWALLLAECYGFRGFAPALEGSSDGGLAATLPMLEGQARLTLDFGRTDLEGAGLRGFKLGCSCHKQKPRYTVLGGNAAGLHGITYSLLRPVLRRFPPRVVRALGSYPYRQDA